MRIHALLLCLFLGCDSTCPEPSSPGSTGSTSEGQAATTGEPVPPKIGDLCYGPTDCDGKWLTCLQLAAIGANYCTSLCGAVYGEVCSAADHESDYGTWTRYTCEPFPGDFSLCFETVTDEPYDGP